MGRLRMSRERTTTLAFTCALAIATPAAVAAQSGEWRAYAGDAASTKYSPLDQINADNAGSLQVAWQQSTIPDAVRQGNPLEAPIASRNTPLMAGGLLYVSTGLGDGGRARCDDGRGRLVRRGARGGRSGRSRA